jgi:hypothetical protein
MPHHRRNETQPEEDVVEAKKEDKGSMPHTHLHTSNEAKGFCESEGIEGVGVRELAGRQQ